LTSQSLDDAAFGAASEVTPKFVSPSDPAAQWTGAMRGPVFFAYADNYLVDVKSGIIMDVEASRAIRQAEVGAAKTMIERTEQRFDIKTAYGSGATLDWLVKDKKIASLSLDVKGPDEVAPLVRFVGDELAKVSGRKRERVATQVGKPRLRIGGIRCRMVSLR
jgi:hypothetical protein